MTVPGFATTESLTTWMLPASILVVMPASLNSLRTGPACWPVFPAGTTMSVGAMSPALAARLTLFFSRRRKSLNGSSFEKISAFCPSRCFRSSSAFLIPALLEPEDRELVLDHDDLRVAPEDLPHGHQLGRPHLRELGDCEDRVGLCELCDALYGRDLLGAGFAPVDLDLLAQLSSTLPLTSLPMLVFTPTVLMFLSPLGSFFWTAGDHAAMLSAMSVSESFLVAHHGAHAKRAPAPDSHGSPRPVDHRLDMARSEGLASGSSLWGRGTGRGSCLSSASEPCRPGRNRTASRGSSPPSCFLRSSPAGPVR